MLPALTLLSIVFGTSGLSATSSQASTQPAQPNIILILADDLGYSDIGCYGSEIATPNLDRLAAGGLRFTQFYNAARCCPTRAALLTGRYNHSVGIGHMCSKMGLPGYTTHLSTDCVTLAEAMRQAGYHALMTGKWHVGMEQGAGPMDRGFEHYFGILSGACNYFRPEAFRRLMQDRDPYTPTDPRFYTTDAFTDRAVEFLDQYALRSEPFFLYVAYTAPHAPLHAWPEDIAKYRGKYQIGWDELRKRRYQKQIELGVIDPRWPLSPRDPEAPAWAERANKDTEDLKMSVYAAQIDRMDRGIGRIMDKVQKLGIAQDTLIMFLSDNGGCAENLDEGKPGAPIGTSDSSIGYGLPWANVSDTPFRRFKRYTHEGGISTPLIVNWPAVITKGGQMTNQIGHVIDLLPTFLDAAGVTFPQTYAGREIRPCDGISLRPILEGRERKGHADLCWEHEGHRGVRSGKWKLVARFSEPQKYYHAWELYDMEADRTELYNLASQMPDKVQELDRLYGRWAKRCNVVPWQDLPHKAKGNPDHVYQENGKRKSKVAIKAWDPQLFVDDWILDSSVALMRTLHRPIKDNGGEVPVIAPPEGSSSLVPAGPILFDPRMHVITYTMLTRAMPSGQVLGCTSIEDGLNWSELKSIDDLYRRIPAGAGQAILPTDTHPSSDSPVAWRYGSLWMKMVPVAPKQDRSPDAPSSGGSIIKLRTSRDGTAWKTAPFSDTTYTPEVFLASGPEGGNNGRNDGGQISLFGQAPLRLGDELVFYYAATSYGKNQPEPKRLSGGGIFRARLRFDGFVSVTGLTITTRPLAFEGNSLDVNSSGPVLVEAVDEDDQIRGSCLLAGDDISHRVTFGHKSLRQLFPEGVVRLRFRVDESGNLYSFTFR